MTIFRMQHEQNGMQLHKEIIPQPTAKLYIKFRPCDSGVDMGQHHRRRCRM